MSNTTSRTVGAALACLLSVAAVGTASAERAAPSSAPRITETTSKATIEPTAASPAARSTADWFATADEGERAVLRHRLAVAAETDPAARFGLGAVQFFSGLERFAQSLSCHGAQAPRGLAMLGLMAGQPSPGMAPTGRAEPITHALFRSYLERLHDDMEEAATTLAKVDRAAAIAIPIDLADATVRLTADGEGVSLLDLARQARMLAQPRPRGTRADTAPDAITRLPFTFDTADAVWLQGYANVAMAQLDFALAHDFERLFDQTFHVFFPRAGLAVGEQLAVDQPAGGAFASPDFFDLVAMLHLTDFAVIEPERRAKARERLLEVVRLSRENWRLIESETDAENEWLPGPQQGDAHPVPGVKVSAQEVAAWRKSLDLFEAVLEGEVLVPHPRFDGTWMGGRPHVAPPRGVNLKRFFESSERFDLVLYVTGQGALPFLEDGKVAGGPEWRAAQGAFGPRGLIGTAIWFN